MDGKLVEAELWNGAVVPTGEKYNDVSIQAECEHVFMYVNRGLKMLGFSGGFESMVAVIQAATIVGHC